MEIWVYRDLGVICRKVRVKILEMGMSVFEAVFTERRTTKAAASVCHKLTKEPVWKNQREIGKRFQETRVLQKGRDFNVTCLESQIGQGLRRCYWIWPPLRPQLWYRRNRKQCCGREEPVYSPVKSVEVYLEREKQSLGKPMSTFSFLRGWCTEEKKSVRKRLKILCVTRSKSQAQNTEYI